MEEAVIKDIADAIEWLGWDRLVFATDYPHWDFDDPDYIFRTPVSAANKQLILRDNARKVFRRA